MVDSITNKKLQVTTTSTAGSFLIVPVSQLPEVRSVLDAGQLPYEVDRISIAMDGKPPIIFVNFRRSVDARIVQELLDQQP